MSRGVGPAPPIGIECFVMVPLVSYILSLFLTLATSQICRINIPDSGGASTRPISFPSPEVTLLRVPGHSYCNVTCSFCDGPTGCEAECCARHDCLAWGWAIAGSAHTMCGGQSCEIFTASSSSCWAEVTANPAVSSGYNYAGFIYNSTQVKIGCCGGRAS